MPRGGLHIGKSYSQTFYVVWEKRSKDNPLITECSKFAKFMTCMDRHTYLVFGMNSWVIIILCYTWLISHKRYTIYPDNKIHGANMGLTRALSAPDGPHVGLMNLANRVYSVRWLWSRMQHRDRVSMYYVLVWTRFSEGLSEPSLHMYGPQELCVEIDK